MKKKKEKEKNRPLNTPQEERAAKETSAVMKFKSLLET